MEDTAKLLPARKPINTTSGTAFDHRFKYYNALNLNATRNIPESVLSNFLTYDEDEDVAAGGGENVSYIPNKEKGTSIIVAVFNLIATVVGGGTLSLPYAFKMAGLVTGVFIVIIVGTICTLSANLMLKAGNECGGTSYKGIAVVAFGSIGTKIVEATVVLFTFGVLSGYSVIMGDVLPKILELIIGQSHIHLNAFYMKSWFLSVCWLAVIVTPLCMLKKMSALKYTSIFSLISTSYIVVLLVIKGIQTEIHVGHVDLPNFDWSLRMFVSLPIMALAFIFHFNISPIEGELKEPTNVRVQWVCNITIFVATTIYILTGTFGYINYGSDVESNILKNLTSNHNDIAAQIGNVAFLLVVSFAFPIICYPTRVNIKTFLFKKKTSTWLHVLLTLLIIGAAYGISVTGIDLGFVFGLVGSTAGSLIAYILPGIFYLRVVNDSWKSWRKIMAVFLVVLGCVFAVICTYATIAFSNNSSKPTSQPTPTPKPI